ncbi:MAG TPA: methionine--tRNA ligase subunit beta, partial [Candidatus Acidoferrales bacterium]|nr:methionine--tRNA ligase subunit beta [Candidatus Acidoferrales bacterium]
KWGIPVPGEAPHVFYVWFDALIGYLSAAGGPEYDQRGLWPADLHIVGKEIIRFHAVYWPAFLMAADLPLPKQIWAHGWLLFDSQKMSKSRGNVVRPRPIVNALGIEPLRYYMLREIVFGQDGGFSYDAMVTRYNSDLANGLGNLASRTLTMIDRYFGAEIPKPAVAPEKEMYAPAAADFAAEALANITKLYDRFNFSQSLEAIWEMVSAIDKFLTVEKPWTLAEKPEDRDRLATVLYSAAEGLRMIAVLAHPVLPQATIKIWNQLGQTEPLGQVQFDQLAWGQLKPGTKIGKPEGIFPRVDKSETIARIEAMEQEPTKAPEAAPSPAVTPAPSAANPPAAAAAAPAASKIGIEDFAKVEMRVGLVKAAERVAGADKLLQLQVDIGDEVRQIVAGLALAYKPEDLVGRKVVVVTNLQPRKLRGVESNGMIVAASLPDGAPVLAGFLEDVPVGARLK